MRDGHIRRVPSEDHSDGGLLAFVTSTLAVEPEPRNVWASERRFVLTEDREQRLGRARLD